MDREKIRKEREGLPICDGKESIIDAVSRNKTTIIVGETGSGKTTQVPQYIFEGFKSNGVRPSIAITQPRRVAAITVAKRVADEMGVNVGELVGYCVRFEDETSFKTKIKFMTDGMLLREAMLDQELKRYNVIILDEAHERTLDTDILFGTIKMIQKEKRPDLRIVVMSATLESDRFAKFYDGAPILYVEGRQYPVDTFFTTVPQDDYLDAALITVIQIALDEAKGDVLVFLPGQEDIEGLAKLLTARAHLFPTTSLKLLVCPLYAALPPEIQMQAFEPTPDGCRKIVLATNIAETSITIKGIKYVVDTGLVKARSFDSRIGMDALQIVPSSKASVRQRMGRAGRDSPGKCFRLFTESSFFDLDEFALPEIRRVNLESFVLALKALGINDVMNFEILDKPPTQSIVKAMETLFCLGALDKTGNLTVSMGKRMAELPLDPSHGRALILSNSMLCLNEMLTIISMLSAENVLYTPQDKREDATAVRRRYASFDGDHITLLNIYNAFLSAKGSSADKRRWCKENYVNWRSLRRVADVRQQLADYCTQFGYKPSSCLPNTDPIRQCLALSFFRQAARIQEDGSYITLVNRQVARIHPSSVLCSWRKPDYIIYNELVLTSKKYLRGITVVDAQDLRKVGILDRGMSAVAGVQQSNVTEQTSDGKNMFTPTGKLIARK